MIYDGIVDPIGANLHGDKAREVVPLRAVSKQFGEEFGEKIYSKTKITRHIRSGLSNFLRSNGAKLPRGSPENNRYFDSLYGIYVHELLAFRNIRLIIDLPDNAKDRQHLLDALEFFREEMIKAGPHSGNAPSTLEIVFSDNFRSTEATHNYMDKIENRLCEWFHDEGDLLNMIHVKYLFREFQAVMLPRIEAIETRRITHTPDLWDRDNVVLMEDVLNMFADEGAQKSGRQISAARVWSGALAELPDYIDTQLRGHATWNTLIHPNLDFEELDVYFDMLGDFDWLEKLLESGDVPKEPPHGRSQPVKKRPFRSIGIGMAGRFSLFPRPYADQLSRPPPMVQSLAPPRKLLPPTQRRKTKTTRKSRPTKAKHQRVQATKANKKTKQAAKQGDTQETVTATRVLRSRTVTSKIGE